MTSGQKVKLPAFDNYRFLFRFYVFPQEECDEKNRFVESDPQQSFLSEVSGFIA